MPIWNKIAALLLVSCLWTALVGCLPYIKTSSLTSEKELTRIPDQTKSEFLIDYRLTANGLLFNYSETQVTYEKVKKEKEYSISRSPDTSSKKVSCVFTRDTLEAESYWNCMLFQPLRIMGLGYAFTIPAMLIDLISLPFVVAFSGSKSETTEEVIPTKKKEIQNPKVKLKLQNEGIKFDKTFAFKDGTVEIPFSKLDANLLWRSNDETVSKIFHYYYSVVDSSGTEVIPMEVFNGLKFRDDKNFLALATKDFEKAKQTEYTKCSRKFSLDNIRDGYKYFEDSGLFLRENELVVQVILNRACYNYRGTDSFDDCVDDFKSCVSTARYIDNKNNQYRK
ncbi:hypothetical protein [Leptospira dzoumogneensis]|uniref:Lipoprotein n=1 Tax=Leptospira dzoumogneensis TaxID=2484904 RepID=A0A4Z1A9L5_9LEPT|nr:hypothetical protein [Leptospira dzoumogneensis]TGM97292.1 hypothetical protein EHR06_14165 [Leptospira dzoumogneensis]